MNPKRITNNLIKEEYFYLKHPSGLEVYVYPKKGYCSNYAIFGTNFGSINNKFKINKKILKEAKDDSFVIYRYRP